MVERCSAFRELSPEVREGGGGGARDGDASPYFLRGLFCALVRFGVRV